MRCAFWGGFGLVQRGEMAQGGGWLARAGTLVDQHGLDCVEGGYLLLPQALMAIGCGDLDAALDRFGEASELAQPFGDRDLAALAAIPGARRSCGRAARPTACACSTRRWCRGFDDRLEVVDDLPDVDVHGGGDEAVRRQKAMNSREVRSPFAGVRPRLPRGVRRLHPQRRGSRSRRRPDARAGAGLARAKLVAAMRRCGDAAMRRGGRQLDVDTRTTLR